MTAANARLLPTVPSCIVLPTLLKYAS